MDIDIKISKEVKETNDAFLAWHTFRTSLPDRQDWTSEQATIFSNLRNRFEESVRHQEKLAGY